MPSYLVRRSSLVTESEASGRCSIDESGPRGRKSIACSSVAFVQDFIASGKLSGDEAPSAAAERAVRRQELRESDLGEDNHRKDFESTRRSSRRSSSLREEQESRPKADSSKLWWAAVRQTPRFQRDPSIRKAAKLQSSLAAARKPPTKPWAAARRAEGQPLPQRPEEGNSADARAGRATSAFKPGPKPFVAPRRMPGTDITRDICEEGTHANAQTGGTLRAKASARAAQHAATRRAGKRSSVMEAAEQHELHHLDGFNDGSAPLKERVPREFGRSSSADQHKQAQLATQAMQQQERRSCWSSLATAVQGGAQPDVLAKRPGLPRRETLPAHKGPALPAPEEEGDAAWDGVEGAGVWPDSVPPRSQAGMQGSQGAHGDMASLPTNGGGAGGSSAYIVRV